MAIGKHEVQSVKPLDKIDGISSSVWMWLDGANEASSMSQTVRRYVVTCGEGIMVIGGKTQALYPGAEVTVQPDEVAQGAGQVLMVATCVPPFDKRNMVLAPQQLTAEQFAEYAHPSQIEQSVV